MNCVCIKNSSSSVWELLQWSEVSACSTILSTTSTAQVKKSRDAAACSIACLCFDLISQPVVKKKKKWRTALVVHLVLWICRRGPLPEPTYNSRGMFSFFFLKCTLCGSSNSIGRNKTENRPCQYNLSHIVFCASTYKKKDNSGVYFGQKLLIYLPKKLKHARQDQGLFLNCFLYLLFGLLNTLSQKKSPFQSLPGSG